jgi:hypothetical protein
MGGRALCSVDVPQPEATALQSVQACAGRLGAADFSPAHRPSPAGSALTCYKGFPTFVKQNSIVVNRVAIDHET